MDKDWERDRHGPVAMCRRASISGSVLSAALLLLTLLSAASLGAGEGAYTYLRLCRQSECILREPNQRNSDLVAVFGPLRTADAMCVHAFRQLGGTYLLSDRVKTECEAIIAPP